VRGDLGEGCRALDARSVDEGCETDGVSDDIGLSTYRERREILDSSVEPKRCTFYFGSGKGCCGCYRRVGDGEG